MEEPSGWAGAVHLSLCTRGTGRVWNAVYVSVAILGAAWFVRALIGRVSCKVDFNTAGMVEISLVL